MSDSELRGLQRRVAADPTDRQAVAALAAIYAREETGSEEMQLTEPVAVERIGKESDLLHPGWQLGIVSAATFADLVHKIGVRWGAGHYKLTHGQKTRKVYLSAPEGLKPTKGGTNVKHVEEINDQECRDQLIVSVEKSHDHWVFGVDDLDDCEEISPGWFYAGCPIVSWIDPKPGDILTTYGKGLGYVIRGCAVNGWVAFYRPPEEEEARRAAEVAKIEADQDAATEAFRATKKHLEPSTMKLLPGHGARYAQAKAKNDDPYGGECFQFAERWAVLMEKRLAEGRVTELGRPEKLRDFAKDLSREADTSGITGFMYGAAVSILSQHWIHGEELRQWHNLTTQINDEGERANREGGTLNPALLNIRTPE